MVDARADLVPEIYYGATIKDARAQASAAGGNSELRLRIINDGAEPLIFLGVQSEFITRSKILAHTSRGKFRPLGSVRIPVEEELDLNTNHMVVELSGLKVPFTAGQVVTLNLSFVSGVIPIEVHIH